MAMQATLYCSCRLPTGAKLRLVAESKRTCCRELRVIVDRLYISSMKVVALFRFQPSPKSCLVYLIKPYTLKNIEERQGGPWPQPLTSACQFASVRVGLIAGGRLAA